MTLSYVMLQNLKRNRLRTGLTLIAFALPMVIFVAAISFITSMAKDAMNAQKQLRLGVHHKTSIVNMLPEAHRRKIEELDPGKKRLAGVCGMRWFGGKVPDTKDTITSLAADPDTFPDVYSDTEMNAAEREQWMRDRRSAVVGKRIADRYGWKVGDRVELESTVPPYLKLEFYVIKIVDANTRAVGALYFRRDYLSESLKTANSISDQVNVFWVKCSSAADLRTLQEDIDSAFATSNDQTKSEDENAFFANFVQAAGDAPSLMQVMAILVLVISALVAGNTMMMSLRERMREFATFKAIGFPSWRIASIVMTESTVLALIGAIAGVVPTLAFMYLVPISKILPPGPFGATQPSLLAGAISIVIALVVGVFAGAWPAVQALRLRTVDALRRVG